MSISNIYYYIFHHIFRIIYICIICGCIGIYISSISYAKKITREPLSTTNPLESRRDQASAKIDSRQQMQDIQQTISIGDIYDTIYDQVSLEGLADQSQAVSAYIAYLYNSYPLCSVKNTNIIDILAQIDEFHQQIDFMSQSHLSSDQPKNILVSRDYADSCIRYTMCIDGQDYVRDRASRVTYMNDRVLRDCKDILRNDYNKFLKLNQNINSLEGEYMADDTLVNGDIADGPFDLLYDMQLIGDIMFRDNRPAQTLDVRDISRIPSAMSAGTSMSQNSREYRDQQISQLRSYLSGKQKNISDNDISSKIDTYIHSGNDISVDVQSPSRISQIRTCASSCNSRYPKKLRSIDDNMYCKIGCLCGSIDQEQGLFGVSYCVVPSSASTTSCSSKSIQGLIECISSKVAQISQSNLDVHIARTESFDPGLYNFNFAKKFNLDLSMINKSKTTYNYLGDGSIYSSVYDFIMSHARFRAQMQDMLDQLQSDVSYMQSKVGK